MKPVIWVSGSNVWIVAFDVCLTLWYFGLLKPRCCLTCLRFLLGISVVLDLTPNYLGAAPWFGAGDLGDVMEKVKVGHTHHAL